jgi:hypothetical protein
MYSAASRIMGDRDVAALLAACGLDNDKGRGGAGRPALRPSSVDFFAVHPRRVGPGVRAWRNAAPPCLCGAGSDGDARHGLQAGRAVDAVSPHLRCCTLSLMAPAPRTQLARTAASIHGMARANTLDDQSLLSLCNPTQLASAHITAAHVHSSAGTQVRSCSAQCVDKARASCKDLQGT